MTTKNEITIPRIGQKVKIWYGRNVPYPPVSVLQSAVLKWYGRNGRHDLPWRNLPSLGIKIPYGVMVSEFMLQQTQVDRVVPKYLTFLKHFPTLASLASSPPAEVIALWAGLGYNRRAVFLHKAAQYLYREYGDSLPRDPDLLVCVPGIGPYTAGAIAAFGYNEPCAVVDTNIERFFELLFFGYSKPSPKAFQTIALQWVPEEKSHEWYSALMDLMSVVRREKTPLAQQAKLLQELASQTTWPLPHLSDEPLVRPKQSPFKQSNRYYRGKVLRLLSEKRSVPLYEVRQLLHDLPSAFSLEKLLADLKKEGLVVYDKPGDGMVRLPE